MKGKNRRVTKVHIWSKSLNKKRGQGSCCSCFESKYVRDDLFYGKCLFPWVVFSWLILCCFLASCAGERGSSKYWLSPSCSCIFYVIVTSNCNHTRDNASCSRHAAAIFALMWHTLAKSVDQSPYLWLYSIPPNVSHQSSLFTPPAGEKPFECRLCGQRSRDYSAMIKHLRTHNGASPYQCTVCLEFCSSLVAMQRHIKSHAEQDFPPGWSINSTYLYNSHIWETNCGIIAF